MIFACCLRVVRIVTISCWYGRSHKQRENGVNGEAIGGSLRTSLVEAVFNDLTSGLSSDAADMFAAVYVVRDGARRAIPSLPYVVSSDKCDTLDTVPYVGEAQHRRAPIA